MVSRLGKSLLDCRSWAGIVPVILRTDSFADVDTSSDIVRKNEFQDVFLAVNYGAILFMSLMQILINL